MSAVGEECSDQRDEVSRAAIGLWQKAGVPFRLQFTGESMGSLLPAGATLDVDPTLSNPRVGDVVVYRSGDRLVIHRIILRFRSGGEDRWVAMGDNNDEWDPPICASDIVGTVVGMREGSRSVRFCGWRWRFAGRLVALQPRLAASLAMMREGQGLPPAAARAWRWLGPVRRLVCPPVRSWLRMASAAAVRTTGHRRA